MRNSIKENLMRLPIFSILTLLVSFSAVGQTDEAKNITSRLDTLSSLTNTGKVIHISYQFSINYFSDEHNEIESLKQFCASEIRYSIRREVIKFGPISVEDKLIKSNILPTLDSIFRINQIQLLRLSLKKLE